MNEKAARSVRPEVAARFDNMVAMRRDLHRNPEKAFAEARTAATVAERLREAGCEVRTGIAGTGVQCVVGPAEARAILLRADMDALPIQEETGAVYSSQVPGVMHACGHDGHTSILVETARLAQAHRDQLPGRLSFVFQPAEEGPGGALPMIEAGVLENPKVEAAFGLHLWSGLPVGKIAVTSGAAMAAADEFLLRIGGKGGHGAFPHETVDAVVAGSYVVAALQTLVSRNADPFQTSVVTIGTFHAGSNFNIIAETAEMRGTLRTFDPGLRELLIRRLREVAEGTARALGATCEMVFQPHYPPTVNDPVMSEFAAEVAAEIVGPENVVRNLFMMASEDMSFFLQRLPGCYLFLGAGNEAKGFTHPHHSPHFDFDEEAMPLGCELFLRLGERYFEKFPESRRPA